MNLVNWKIHFSAQELRKNNLFVTNAFSLAELVLDNQRGKRGFLSSKFAVAFRY